MAGFRTNALWAVIGFPLGLLSFLFYLYSRRHRIDLKDKVVLITGASSGLGEACAEAFYAAGCKLILSGRKLQTLTALRDRLMKTNVQGGHSPAIVTLDLENLTTIPNKINQAVAAFGRIDILVNNAGMSYRGSAADTKLEVDMRLMTVNYFGHIEITKAVVQHMITQQSGTIVAISSVQGRIAIPHRSAYAASKHALQAYFDSLRAELTPHNINVSVLSPYYIDTNLSQNALEGDGSTYGKRDKTTSSGMKANYVADKVVDCVVHGINELTLAPFHVQMAIGIRALAPWLFFKLMASRAKKEIMEMEKSS